MNMVYKFDSPRYDQIILMQTDNIAPSIDSTPPPSTQNQNPQLQVHNPKIHIQNLNTNPSSITSSISPNPIIPSAIHLPVPGDSNHPQEQPKADIQDQMQKYFEQYAVMQSIPSSKRLQPDTKPPNSKPHTNKKPQTSDEQESQSNIDQQELYRYKQLQNRLNFALNKIQICKESSTKSLKMSSEDSDELYKRFQYYERKKKGEIERRKQEKEEEELRELQKKPVINATSNRIVGSLEPIYERYERVLNQKERKLEEERLRIKKQKEEEEELFFREFEERNKRPDKVRTVDEFYDSLVRWKEKKIEKNNEKLESNKKVELSAATFQPEINGRSKRLMDKKPPREPIHTRQPKVKEVVQEYSFKPKINKKVPNFN